MRLEAKNISFRYHKTSPWIFRGLHFYVETGEAVGVLAPSGYGKSTLALLLAGYRQPEQGEILLDGKPLPTKGVCPVQLIAQHPEYAINPRWRLRKVLEESGGKYDDSFLLEKFGIEPAWLTRFPQEVSGGELQRFCIARALLSGASFFICDEISTMLDAITQAQMWDILLQEMQQRKVGLVVITHHYPLAQKICSRIYDLTAQ